MELGKASFPDTYLIRICFSYRRLLELHARFSSFWLEQEAGTMPYFEGSRRTKCDTDCIPDLGDIQRNAGIVNCIMTDMFLWRRSTSDSPLNSRGCVFQERLLAPRILHFGGRQLFWECGILGAYVSFPKGLSMTSYRSMT